jgi:bifunctional NMN adenylyltransferase/nudix hydrolase
METSKKDLTVIIGRFSPLHNGHCELIQRALKTSKAVLILIGSADQARNTKNPFTYLEREQLIRDYTWAGHNIATVRILPLHDHPYNDQAWIREVQDAVDKTKTDLADIIGLNPETYLSGSDRDKSTYYLKMFGDFFKLDLIEQHPVEVELSATKVRHMFFDQHARADSLVEIEDIVPAQTVHFLSQFRKTEMYTALVKEYEFVEGYKTAWKIKTNKPICFKDDTTKTNQQLINELQELRGKIGVPYAPIFSTVDTVVIQSGHILVNVRGDFPGVGLWALPGGFLEQDETLLDGAIRELIEETSIGLSKAQLYGSVKSKEIFDYPTRSLRGRTITTCFLLKLDDSKPLPKLKPQKGEVIRTMWLPINEALKNPQNWFEDHYHVVVTMVGRL